MKNYSTTLLQRSAVLAGMAILSASQATADPRNHRNGNWPDQIPIGIPGFEAEGIERGRGQDIFVGALSYSSLFGGAPHLPPGRNHLQRESTHRNRSSPSPCYR